jgi:murein L,D-transpeptidase YcbB/YkuD
MRPLLPTTLTLIVALLLASALPSAAQPSAPQAGSTPQAAQPAASRAVDELIRADVEQLRATGDLELDGVMIASRNLLPRIYEARAFTPTWRNQAQIDALLETIDESYKEGLDPSDYHIDQVRAARAAYANVDALPAAERAALDVMLTDSVIRLGYHLRFGKVDPVALNPNWNLKQDLMGRDPAVTIQRAIDAPSMREFADSAIPRVFLYQRFKEALARYRELAAAGGWPALPTGPTLKPGMTDTRVPNLAERLAITGDIGRESAAAATTSYSGAVVDGVKHFQDRHGLSADGALGPGTLAALNVPVETRIEQIRANLERARWVFYDPESEFLVVNIAGFKVYLVRRGEVVWRSRVQVGRPYRQTPIFASTLSYLVFNPTWTVPPTILRQDYLPQLKRNPHYLAEHNIDVLDRAGKPVEQASIDWSSARSLQYQLVQRPGPTNALGRVKFMFPNEYFVYLHDTPSRDLFDKESRAFSSGCIRVENPLELADVVLGDKWPREKIDALIAAGRTQTVILDKPIAVKLLYWTAEVDAAGRVSFFPDVYSRDDELINALAQPFMPTEDL